MATKRKVARPVHANRGIEARYRVRIHSLIREMNDSVLYWVAAMYNKTPPILAQDASPVKSVKRQMRELSTRWIQRFDDAAPKIAEAYLAGAFKATDSAMRAALKASGWSVKFDMTPAMRESFEASLAENVGLIRSIPAEYLQQVEGIVMRGYAAGRDLATMTRALRALYPKAANRAVLIARDQSNKANAVVQKARQLELGIVEAVWHHSHAGKTPRPDHVAADGKRYKVAEGCLISGEYIYPGELINCRCVGRAVLPYTPADAA